MAPASSGAFGGDLLVGNFGDGTINVYDPSSFALKGQLQDSTGKPIQNDNLWEILFGSNGTGDPNTLYFSAGVNNEKGGLFGAITATAAPAKGDFTVNVAQSALTVTQGGSATVQVSVSPSNGFASPITFTVSGLPTGATFAFSPTSLTPAAGANASTTLTITAGTYTVPSPNPYSTSRLRPTPTSEFLAAGVLVPIGLAAFLPVLRNRKKFLKSLFMGGGTLITPVRPGISCRMQRNQKRNRSQPGASRNFDDHRHRHFRIADAHRDAVTHGSMSRPKFGFPAGLLAR